MGEPDLRNYWEVSLVEGAVNVVMSMSLGDNVTVIEVLSSGNVEVDKTSEVREVLLCLFGLAKNISSCFESRIGNISLCFEC